ncbi:MAG: alternate F1F0 ATPase, F1 subunit alpha [Negativicutes bacterium]|nr:alternate F1F0 ATPase, F1 subunit alpha [Negativicutes bacterium]
MATKNDGLSRALYQTFSSFRQGQDKVLPHFEFESVGKIRTIANGVAWLEGLDSVAMEELVRFPGGIYGIVLNIEDTEIGVVMLGESSTLKAGDDAHRTGRVADVPVGNSLLGRIINPLGFPLDDKGTLLFSNYMSIEKAAPPIMDRLPVKVPLQTGIKVIDALIPIGRGQRQLILGDQQTGKTAIAIDAIINQRDTGVICIYCAIGQQGASLAKTVAALSANGAMEYTIVVVAEGSEAPGLRYIAPYAATTIGEYFMEQGMDVLLVYDDLTNHADTYREISLLLRRPPGREAFPGDIFYLHSRLLERCARLKSEKGGGSLTALPIIQTESQNISAYIPTNLISITDGQIYLSPQLFEKGILPAVDVGKSVSRIGAKAQLKAYQKVVGDLKLAYSQFEELEMFSRFGTRMDEKTRQKLEYGWRIRECLKQQQYNTLSVPKQISVLLALTNNLFDALPLSLVPKAELNVLELADKMPQETQQKILNGELLTEETKKSILQVLGSAIDKMEDKDGANTGGGPKKD